MGQECWNILTIMGSKHDIQQLADSQLEFNRLYPVPENALPDTVTWKKRHWGTKWDRWEYVVLLHEENALHVTFTTANTPPFNIIRHIVDRMPRSWLKLIFSTEDNAAGIFIHYRHQNRSVTRHMMWQEPDSMTDASGNIQLIYEHDEIEC
jgi:hypothetical protein